MCVHRKHFARSVIEKNHVTWGGDVSLFISTLWKPPVMLLAVFHVDRMSVLEQTETGVWRNGMIYQWIWIDASMILMVMPFKGRLDGMTCADFRETSARNVLGFGSCHGSIRYMLLCQDNLHTDVTRACSLIVISRKHCGVFSREEFALPMAQQAGKDPALIDRFNGKVDEIAWIFDGELHPVLH